jgi:hypothetical protein
LIIVESQNEKEQFLDYWNNEESVIIPIFSDLERHPINNGLSFLYVRFPNLDFILPFNHNDCEKLEIDLTTSNKKKWCWDKKSLLQMDLGINKLKDVQTALFFINNKIYPFRDKIEVLTNFYYRLGIRDDLGKSIPIMKWLEVLRGIVDDWKLDTTNTWVDETMIPILSDVERLGIRVDREKFLDRWSSNHKSIKDKESRVYTEYNPYTITSRPSNRHLGINYGALNKKDGSRECFVPNDGKTFLQFDYDAYHVRIIAKLIGYELPKTSVHQWLADQYECSYDESKGRTFRILYGGVSDEDRKIPFFDKVDMFIRKMHEQAIKNGYLTTPKGRKIPLGWIEQPTAQKYFNYILQASETEFNIESIKRLKENDLPLPILYTYDSFLYEFGIEDKEIILKVKETLESFGFPVKQDWGSDYSKL